MEATLTTSIKVLSSGIDSLYISLRGEVRRDVAESLERLKTMARDSGQGQRLELHGAVKAVVLPSGWGRYRYWVRCDGFDIFLAIGASVPTAYAQLKSALIHEVGPRNALAEVELFINGGIFAEPGEVRCSRVDIYSDFQGWVPRSVDYERFTVRSRRNTWHVAVHHNGRSFTGFTFGRDAMVARLYDKSLEMNHSGKDWMREVWSDRRDGSQPVWRLEFQLRRQLLRECGLNSADDVIEDRDRLWRDVTQWLSLRQPQPVARRVRWPVADVWNQLAQARMESRAAPLIRQRIKKQDQLVLVRGLAGYASSLAAVNGVSDLDVAMAVSRRRLGEYLDESRRDFRDLVRAKVNRSVTR